MHSVAAVVQAEVRLRWRRPRELPLLLLLPPPLLLLLLLLLLLPPPPLLLLLLYMIRSVTLLSRS
jgi:hypothetical protein